MLKSLAKLCHRITSQAEFLIEMKILNNSQKSEDAIKIAQELNTDLN
jgi:hypothetical protein